MAKTPEEQDVLRLLAAGQAQMAEAMKQLAESQAATNRQVTQLAATMTGVVEPQRRSQKEEDEDKASHEAKKKEYSKSGIQLAQEAADRKFLKRDGDYQFLCRILNGGRGGKIKVDASYPPVKIWAASMSDARGRYMEVCGITGLTFPASIQVLEAAGVSQEEAQPAEKWQDATPADERLTGGCKPI